MTATAHLSIDTCPDCSGSKVCYDPQVKVGRFGTLKLCQCVEKECRCRGEQPYQYWEEDSVLKWCPCAPARRRLSEVQRLFKLAEIPARFRWKFQDDFFRTAPDGEAIEAATKARGYVSTLLDVEKPGRGFVLHGPPGTGKTLLGCIMLNELILHRARAGRFLSLSRKYFQQLRDTFSENSERRGQTWQIQQELGNLPYLLLDDFGIQRGTEFEMEKLYELVDARYSEKRFTIVTTNLQLDDIRNQSSHIYSRLAEMCHFFDMTGPDFRTKLHPVG